MDRFACRPRPERLLPGVLAGTGPRWLGAMADLAAVAARVGDPAYARSVYNAMLPYQGRLVVWGGANTITGPVDEYLGRLAVRLGDLDPAVDHFSRAAELAERNGALPWLAQALAGRSLALSTRGIREDRRAAEDDLARARLIAGAEREALLDELRRGSGLGGRSRAHPDAAERARVNVTRALWTAVRRVESAAPLVGAHLRASLRTGRVLRYQPAPGGPARWRT